MSRAVAELVASGEVDYGVLMCWTGTGTAIAANKVAGVRAAQSWEPWVAENARRWNDANVLTLSLKRTAPAVAVDCVNAFLDSTSPTGTRSTTSSSSPVCEPRAPPPLSSSDVRDWRFRLKTPNPKPWRTLLDPFWVRSCGDAETRGVDGDAGVKRVSVNEGQTGTRQVRGDRRMQRFVTRRSQLRRLTTTAVRAALLSTVS